MAQSHRPSDSGVKPLQENQQDQLSRSLCRLRGVITQRYGANYGMQKKTSSGLHGTSYKMFWGANKSSGNEGIREFLEEPTIGKWSDKVIKGPITCK